MDQAACASMEVGLDAMTHAMLTFESFLSSRKDIDAVIITTLHQIDNPVPYTDIPLGLKEGFIHWKNLYDSCAGALEQDAICDLGKQYLWGDNLLHDGSPYCIVQGMMKSAIHALWKCNFNRVAGCYDSDATNIYANPSIAVRLAFGETREEIAIDLFRELMPIDQLIFAEF